MARPVGSLNKSTKELKALAQVHTVMAVARLAKIAKSSPNETNAVMACKELLDRAHGKAVQGVEIGGKDGAPLVIEMVRFGAPSSSE